MTNPSIVFVHGIWADGSSFGKVIPALQSEGYEVSSTQNTLRSTACSASSNPIIIWRSHFSSADFALGKCARARGVIEKRLPRLSSDSPRRISSRPASC
jgi:hypothetical protein